MWRILQGTLRSKLAPTWVCTAMAVGNATKPPHRARPCCRVEIMEDSSSPFDKAAVVGTLKVVARRVAQETVRDSF